MTQKNTAVQNGLEAKSDRSWGPVYPPQVCLRAAPHLVLVARGGAGTLAGLVWASAPGGVSRQSPLSGPAGLQCWQSMSH